MEDTLLQFVPRNVAEGDEMHFGASTRRYTLKRRPTSGNERISKKRSVSWPDEADAAGALCCCPSHMVQCAWCMCTEHAS